MRRYLYEQVTQDLNRKMVFLGGARQVGKTTLALELCKESDGHYFNWDDDLDRSRLLERDLPLKGLHVFDELHKFRRWRNWIKGLYDKNKSQAQFLVTGSARLDYYRFGGDSLQGRYHYLRLHPLSVAELKIQTRSDLEHLFERGGFPEPFFSLDAEQAQRWTREYRSRFIREDLQSLESVADLGRLEQLIIRLPDLIGSPLSINALREDLECAHKTVSKWIQMLERLYIIFRISPFGGPKIQAVKKEQKHYHLNWALVKDEGARFENLVACHLLKWCHYQEDTKGIETELRFFRNRSGQEVDFVVLENGKPRWFIECKLHSSEVSKTLSYLKQKFPEADALQLHWRGDQEKATFDGVKIQPAAKFLATLI